MASRKPSIRIVALMLGAALALGNSLAGEEPLPFDMPTPEGWRTETIPFPLSFAPELKYEGLEELRFSPGMFEEGSPQFWSYAFVWWLPAGTQLEASQLEQDFIAYFRGLTSPPDPNEESPASQAKFAAKIQELAKDEQGRRRLEGNVSTFDSFVTQKPMELEVRITIWDCGTENTVAFFELSPQPFDHEVWTQLAEIREGFACTHS